MVALAACSNGPNSDLADASYNGDLSAVKAALAAKADVNSRNSSNATALMVAAGQDHPDVVTALLAAGADPNATDPDNGYSAIIMAHSDAVISALAHGGANLNARETRQGATALYLAVQGRHPDVARALVANGADVNAPDNLGQTPLMAAAINGDYDDAEVLIGAGADVNTRLPAGQTALSYAVGTPPDAVPNERKDDVVQLLRDHGAAS